jgi:hypothetical protein
MHSLFGFDASGLTLRKCDWLALIWRH